MVPADNFEKEGVASESFLRPNAKLSYPERAYKLRVKGERETEMSKKDRLVAARG